MTASESEIIRERQHPQVDGVEAPIPMEYTLYQEVGIQQHLFRAVFEQSKDAILIANDDGCYVAANSAACLLLGRSLEEVLQLTIADITEPTLLPVAADAWQRFLDQGEMEGEYRIVRPDGQTVHAEYRAVANV